MKRIVFTLFLLFTSSLTVLWAQVNPKPGYIITLGGDTLRGTIDYRTDGRNARVCLFCREGDTEFGRYSPADISGYRLTDNGAFYVSRRVPIDGEEKTLFLEYLIKGGVSLSTIRKTPATIISSSMPTATWLSTNRRLTPIPIWPRTLPVSGDGRWPT
jgi:hypothetical protein